MTIKVTVRSGMVEDVDGIPAGVDVEINDYDITPAGDEELEADSTMEQDSDGDWYQIQGWAGSTAVNAHDALMAERKVVADILDYVWMGGEVPASIVRDYHVAKAAADAVIGEVK
jgi:hypothetical protein